ncbi:MAG: nitrate reductase [Chthoniobacteraceae bacterium]
MFSNDLCGYRPSILARLHCFSQVLRGDARAGALAASVVIAERFNLLGAAPSVSATVLVMIGAVLAFLLAGWDFLLMTGALQDPANPLHAPARIQWKKLRRIALTRVTSSPGLAARWHGGRGRQRSVRPDRRGDLLCARLWFAPHRALAFSLSPRSRPACPASSQLQGTTDEKLIDHAASQIRVWEGPLTRDLVQAPCRFGLGRVPERLKPDATTTMVCGFCSTGCGLNVHLKDGSAINLSAATDYPVNLGMACPKGWEALSPLAAPDRATTPLLRNEKGELEPVDWERALLVFTAKFRELQEKYGPDSLAWLGTGQICTEELAFLGSLAKFGMGIRHGDGNTRQCMATAATAYKQSFGFDAPPFTYADFEESDVIVLVGSNLCIAHPIMWQRVMRNKNRPEIVVIDPRKTETAMAATQHCAIAPKSDLTLLYGLANILIASGWIDRDYIAAHTTGYEEFAQFVTRFTSDHVSSVTGLSVEEIWRLAETIRRGKRVSFWWTMGVNQGHEATRTAQAIINLALITGNLGRPGTGANSVTGQCNAMGSRLFSNTTGLLGGHDFLNPAHRTKIAGLLGLDPACIPDSNSLAYDQIVDAIEAGKIKGLWIVATNTSHSWIQQDRLREIAKKLEFLVVQDMYCSTETAQLAHLVLPAAGWGEKDGTFINSERRIGLVKRVSRAPGQALSDFSIFRLIAEYWGCSGMFARWTAPEAVFQILKEITRGQPCDITGIRDYRMIDEAGGIQWPLPEGTMPEKERRLFEEGRYYFADGKARLLFEEPRPMAEPADEEFPFLLLTGRGSSSQWHTLTRTGKSDVLRKLGPSRIYVEIHPRDAQALGITAGASVEVCSRRGRLVAQALVTPIVQPGQVFIPMHFEETNRLTHSSFDPYSRQPSYKACAVALRRAHGH